MWQVTLTNLHFYQCQTQMFDLKKKNTETSRFWVEFCYSLFGEKTQEWSFWDFP